jgi:glycosyltransferase involved in cell wall biosynthesis
VTNALHVVLVEPYYGGSHRAWADGLVVHSTHQIRLITHPDQFWRWRMRGGAVTLAAAIRRDLAVNGPPDVVVVSEMVDLAALLGLLRRDLPRTPVALYVHEDQLVHPLAPGQPLDEGLALRNWTSLVAADAVWFNSHFHRDAFFDALPELLRRPPDERHLHLIDAVRDRSTVLHVGVDVADLLGRSRPAVGGPPLVVWNQRWDSDKNPEPVFRALVRLASQGVDFRLAIAGENSRVDPREFAWVADRLGDRVVHMGELDRADYVDLLVRSDVHVTAAEHEFFGVAPVEAVAAGCLPVWPHRQSYPELIPDAFHADALYADGDLGSALRRALVETEQLRATLSELPRSMMRFDWSTVATQYDHALAALCS